MSRARTLAGAIGSDGALNVADVAGLAAVASSGSASDLSTGTLPIARIADGAVTSAKIASGVAVANLGYTPVNKAGDTTSGKISEATSSTTGGVHGFLNGSDSLGNNRDYQIDFGFYNGGGYKHYIRTRHDSTAGSVDNAFDFFLSDGTINGGFGTAIRALTVSNAGVLMPKNPGFRASAAYASPGYFDQGSGSDGAHIGALMTTVSGGYGLYNNGGYDTSTGVFTAPVSGYYFAYANARWETLVFVQNNYIRLYIDVNNTGSGYRTGIHAINGMNEAWSDYMAQNVSGVLLLAKGDTVRLRGGMSNGGAKLYSSESGWGVHLIG